MSYLFLETYSTLVIHIVNKCVKNSDNIAYVVNCIINKLVLLLCVFYSCIAHDYRKYTGKIMHIFISILLQFVY
jgi:uncharacterized membrane protein